jgi:hypothetical protein
VNRNPHQQVRARSLGCMYGKAACIAESPRVARSVGSQVAALSHFELCFGGCGDGAGQPLM